MLQEYLKEMCYRGKGDHKVRRKWKMGTLMLKVCGKRILLISGWSAKMMDKSNEINFLSPYSVMIWWKLFHQYHLHTTHMATGRRCDTYRFLWYCWRYGSSMVELTSRLWTHKNRHEKLDDYQESITRYMKRSIGVLLDWYQIYRNGYRK